MWPFWGWWWGLSLAGLFVALPVLWVVSKIVPDLDLSGAVGYVLAGVYFAGMAVLSFWVMGRAKRGTR